MLAYRQVDDLRTYLRSYYSLSDVQSLCDDCLHEINSLILDISSNGIKSAIDAALEMGADDFVDDVSVVQDVNGFGLISTHSGNMDYTRSEKQMLPSLLKNAKTSKDGHRYKVIPIREKPQQIAISMFEQMRIQQDANDLAKNSLRARGQERRNEVAGALQQTLELQRQAASAISLKEFSHDGGGVPEFRTASDRQDPATAWVIPEKNMDLTDTIRDINASIVSQCEQAIAETVQSYYDRY